MSKLANLFKYNARTTFRFLGVFYALVIITAVLTRLSSCLDGGFVVEFIKGFINSLFLAMLATTLINNLMRLWHKIRQNLYGPESYLTQTLPVRGRTLYIAWALVGLTSWFATAGVITLGLLIAYASPESFAYLSDLFTPVAEMLQIPLAKLIIALLIVGALEVFNLFFIGVLAIVIGNRFNKNRHVWSFISGALIYGVSQALILGAVYLLALFNDVIMAVFDGTMLPSFDQLDTVLWIAAILYGTFVVAETFVTAHLLDQGVNIE